MVKTDIVIVMLQEKSLQNAFILMFIRLTTTDFPLRLLIIPFFLYVCVSIYQYEHNILLEQNEKL